MECETMSMYQQLYYYDYLQYNNEMWEIEMSVIVILKMFPCRIISLRGGREITRLTQPFIIGVSVPRQESEQLCICVLWAPTFPLSRILIFDFGIVPTVFFISFI